MALYRSPQPVALPQHDVRRADAVEVHHELVAAQTPHHVADAEVLSQDAGDIGQHEIAHEMTVRIVHVFEAIDVHDQQGARSPPASASSCCPCADEWSRNSASP